MAEISTEYLPTIKKDAVIANQECSSRGLVHSAKWSSELSYSLDQVRIEDVMPTFNHPQNFMAEYDSYIMAKNFFDLREYDRAAHFSHNCSSDKVYFLHMYSRYLSGQKKQLDESVDTNGRLDNGGNEYLKILRLEMHRKYKSGCLDGYCLYLYGVILKKLDLLKEAVDVLIEAIMKEPVHWGAWLELSALCSDKEMLHNLTLPDHWMKHFFLAHTYLELQLNEEAFRMYQILGEKGFNHSTYVIAQIAVAYHNLREVEMSVEQFGKLQKLDPYRLENMDTYSNLLYVKEMRPELAHLAHHCCDIDKYRVETCCVIGNYYSLRAQHDKAVLYFQRALKLNPNYLSAWTLMGHEYVEIKNTSAASQAYRQAIEVNRRDYRAWYGLGQIYEILKMPFYCLYYYRQAQMLRPNDSRMVMALGETYEKLERLQEAKKCFWKAHSIGDIEGQALVKLAKLYEKLSEDDQAAAAYTEFIMETEKQGTFNYDDQWQAFKYLANYHIKRGNLDEAYAAAQKCTEFNETREEGKALLRQISRLRVVTDPVPQVLQHEGVEGSIITERSQSHIPPDQQTPQSQLMPMNLIFTP